MIKTILFDFDGVILDSMKIKADGFMELFKNHGQEELQLLEEYHFKNGGISRFEKIRYFYENILGKTISNDDIDKFAKKFSNIIDNKLYNEKNLIKETIDYIEKNHKDYNFHIVSGAEDTELNNLCKFFDLEKFFLTINGSPTKKAILVKNIMNDYNYSVEDTILIGDSINDYKAAYENGICFYGYNNKELIKFNYIDTFVGFKV